MCFLRLMKIFVLQLILIVFISSNTSAQLAKRVSPKGVNFWEYLPPGYATSSTSYPVIIFLHGLNERGNDNAAMGKVLAYGPFNHVNKKGHDMGFTVNGKKEYFVMVAPQLTTNYGNWPNSYVDDLVRYVIETYKVDKDRVHITGLSLGGGGTFAATYSNENASNKYASATPVCGWADPSKGCVVADRGIAVWSFHGDKDTSVPITTDQNMINAINSCTSPVANPKAKIRIYPGANHYVWDQAYSTDHSYQNPNIYEWMLVQRRKGSTSTPANQAPVAKAGNDATITLPIDYAFFNGSGTDSDGTISSYSWAKISGPNASLQNASTATLKAVNLVEGTYVFRLTVKDNDGASSTDDVKLTVNKAATTSNVAPVVNAGSDLTTTLPYDYAFIYGSATDSDGSIAYYKWTKVSGPNANLQTPNSAILKVVNLVEGTYVFRFTAHDNGGASSYDDVKVTVNKAATTANIAPVAKAGNDISTTLPMDYAFIYGSGTDSDGSISSYLWTKVSGPSASMQTPNSATLKVVNLVEGTYVFRLTVKDNDGATATDDVKLTVYKAVSTNIAPVSNAGNDVSTTLPYDYAFIYGSASDSDGSIAYYNWTKVSGSNATMQTPNSATLKVVNLVEGTYVFRFTVYDNDGASNYDDVKLTVYGSQTANIAPVVNAGNDTTAILPYDYSFITGSATDNDGSIASHKWTKVSGPPASLQITNTATLKVVNLVEGTYVFRLTAYDNDGASNYDDIKLTVYSSQEPPVAPPSSNLVAHWSLNNNAVDVSGNGFDGTLKNGASFTTNGKEGSHALNLNGNDQYVILDNPKQLPAGKSPRSMSAWAKTNDISDEYNWIASYGSPVTSSAMFIGRHGTELNGGGYGDDVIVKDFWKVGVWHHIVLTYDGNTAKMYADGVMVLSEVKNWSLIPENAYIGKQVNHKEAWNGSIDDVRIYNKVLSPSEIQALANTNSSARLADEVKERSTFNSDLKEISVYPNPSSGRFFIDISPEYYSSAEELSITLYDLMGSQVMNKKLPFQEERVDMDISGVKDAVYVYVISSQNGTLKRGKFIKDAGH